jgi:ABC-type transport system involved in multi-copper enzyme maturation permease subunit
MIDLFRAEWAKVSGNRWLTGCLIWIWPIFGVAFIVVASLLLIFNDSFRNDYAVSPNPWTDMAMAAWMIPNNDLVRFVLLGFAATIFASEYQNKTWKMVIPGNSRVVLILTKFVALATFIVAAFSVMMVILLAGGALLSLLAGADYPPELSGEVLSVFLGDLALNASLTFVSTLIWGSLAALMAIATRSILLGVIGSIFLSLLESLALVLILLLASGLIWEPFGDLYVLSPSYNANNIREWVNNDTGADVLLQDGIKFSLGESIIMLALWMVALLSLTIFAFQRQDLS